jgi:hypothetical protein
MRRALIMPSQTNRLNTPNTIIRYVSPKIIQISGFTRTQPPPPYSTSHMVSKCERTPNHTHTTKQSNKMPTKNGQIFTPLVTPQHMTHV